MGFFKNIFKSKKKKEEESPSSPKKSFSSNQKEAASSYKSRSSQNAINRKPNLDSRRERVEKNATDRQNRREVKQEENRIQAKEGQKSANQYRTNSYATNSYSTNNYQPDTKIPDFTGYNQEKHQSEIKERKESVKKAFTPAADNPISNFIDKNDKAANSYKERVQANKAKREADPKRDEIKESHNEAVKKIAKATGLGNIEDFDSNSKEYRKVYRDTKNQVKEDRKQLKDEKKSIEKSIKEGFSMDLDADRQRLREIKAEDKSLKATKKEAKREMMKAADENWTENGNFIQKTHAKTNDMGAGVLTNTLNKIDAVLGKPLVTAMNTFVDGEDDNIATATKKIIDNSYKVMNGEEPDVTGRTFVENAEKGNVGWKAAAGASKYAGGVLNSVTDLVRSPYDIGLANTLADYVDKNGDREYNPAIDGNFLREMRLERLQEDFKKQGKPMMISDVVKHLDQNPITDVAYDISNIAKKNEDGSIAANDKYAPSGSIVNAMRDISGREISDMDRERLLDSAGFAAEFIDPLDVAGAGAALSGAAGINKAIKHAGKISDISDVGTLSKYGKLAQKSSNIEEIAKLATNAEDLNKLNKLYDTADKVNDFNKVNISGDDLLELAVKQSEETGKSIFQAVDDITNEAVGIFQNKNYNETIKDMASKTADRLGDTTKLETKNIYDDLASTENGARTINDFVENRINEVLNIEKQKFQEVVRRNDISEITAAYKEYRNLTDKVKDPEFVSWAKTNPEMLQDDIKEAAYRYQNWKDMKLQKERVDNIADFDKTQASAVDEYMKKYVPESDIPNPDLDTIFKESPEIQDKAAAINKITDMQQQGFQNQFTNELAEQVKQLNQQKISEIIDTPMANKFPETNISKLIEDLGDIDPKQTEDFLRRNDMANNKADDIFQQDENPIVNQLFKQEDTPIVNKLMDDEIQQPSKTFSDNMKYEANDMHSKSFDEATREAQQVDTQSFDEWTKRNYNTSMENRGESGLSKLIREGVSYDSSINPKKVKIGADGKPYLDKVSAKKIENTIRNYDTAAKNTSVNLERNLKKHFEGLPNISKTDMETLNKSVLANDQYEDLLNEGIAVIKSQYSGLDIREVKDLVGDISSKGYISPEDINHINAEFPALNKLMDGVTAEKLNNIDNIVEQKALPTYQKKNIGLDMNDLIRNKKSLDIEMKQKGLTGYTDAIKNYNLENAERIKAKHRELGLPEPKLNKEFYLSHISGGDDLDAAVRAAEKQGGGVSMSSFYKSRQGGANYDTNIVNAIYKNGLEVERELTRLDLFSKADKIEDINKTGEVIQKSLYYTKNDLGKKYGFYLDDKDTNIHSMITNIIDSDVFQDELVREVSKGNEALVENMKFVMKEMKNQGLNLSGDGQEILGFLNHMEAENLRNRAFQKAATEVSQAFASKANSLTPKGYSMFPISSKFDIGRTTTTAMADEFIQAITGRTGASFSMLDADTIGNLKFIDGDNINNLLPGYRVYENDFISAVNKRFNETGKKDNQAWKIFKKVNAVTKAWQTQKNPFTAVKFHSRNALGDLYSMASLQPGTLKHLISGWADAGRYEKTGEIPKYFKEMGYTKEQFQHVVDSLSSSTATFEGMEDFQKYFGGSGKEFIGKNKSMLQKLNPTEVLGDIGQRRELAFRLSSFEYYMKRLEKGDIGSFMFGASNSNEIRAVMKSKGGSNLEHAIVLANDINGNYSNISQMGQMLRQGPIPFYSYMEANFKRYSNALINTLDPRVASEVADMKAVAKGKKGANAFEKTAEYATGITKRTAGLMIPPLVIEGWNRQFDDNIRANLPDNVKDGSYIMLGTYQDENGDNHALYLNGVSTFNDYLEWAGLAEKFQNYMGQNYIDREKANYDNLTIQEKVKYDTEDAIKGVVNKVYQGTNTWLKTPLELFAFKGKTFPDVFNPTEITNMPSYLAGQAGLSAPYNWIQASRGNGVVNPKQEALKLFANESNTDQQMRNNYKYKVMPELDKAYALSKGETYKDGYAEKQFYDEEYAIENDKMNAAAKNVMKHLEAGSSEEKLIKAISEWEDLYRSSGNLAEAQAKFDKAEQERQEDYIAKRGSLSGYNSYYTFDPYYPLKSYINSRFNPDKGIEMKKDNSGFEYEVDNYVNKEYRENQKDPVKRRKAQADAAATEDKIKKAHFRDEFLTDYEKRMIHDSRKKYNSVNNTFNNALNKKIYR